MSNQASNQRSLVERLRAGQDFPMQHDGLVREAADEIERLMQSQWGGVESLAKQRNEALERVAELHADVETLQAEFAKERAAYARSFEAVVEVEALKHDLERVMARENHFLNESERLRAALQIIKDDAHDFWGTSGMGSCLIRIQVKAVDALSGETGVKP